MLAVFLTHLGGCDQGSPCVAYSSGTCCGAGAVVLLSLRKAAREPLHLLFGHLAATTDGAVLSSYAGVPKWLGIWPNDKTGHFVNSCLAAHQLKKEN